MNNTGIFLYSTWLATPLNTRHRIAEALHIKKVRSTHVVNDFVQDDGYNIQDVEAALSVANLQGYLDSKETDLNVLYQNMVYAIENPLMVVRRKTITVDMIKPGEVIVIKKHAKAKKNKQK